VEERERERGGRRKGREGDRYSLTQIPDSVPGLRGPTNMGWGRKREKGQRKERRM